MKIRSHLLLLASGALVPLLLFSIGLTAFSWWNERNALELRQLERVRAMTIALDTELQASIRVMRVLGLAPQLRRDDLAGGANELRELLTSQPLWSMLAVGDPKWRQVISVTPAGESPRPPVIDDATRRQVLEKRQPAISALVHTGDRYHTQLMVPVLRDGVVDLIILVAIDQRAWLGFMSQYPIGPDAILLLLDQDGVIIARTLNNDASVGKPPSPTTLERSRASAESAFRTVTREGEPVYAAHSRSIRWGWTLVTSIPTSTVEEALRESSLMTFAAAMLSIALAVLLAFVFGRRIARPIDVLGAAALALERGDPPPPVEGDIEEVDRVARAFEQAARRLKERQAAVNEALAGEREARRQAEQASQAKDEFLAMLGHELRNPLNAVTSAVAVLKHVDPASDKALRSREIVERQIVNLRQLVDDLLDVARVTSGKITLDRQRLDLAAVVRRSVAVLSSSGRFAKHRIEVDAADPAWIDGDETRLEQIVTNLLDNAIKYTPEGGRIGVGVRAEGAQAKLQVEDSGVGIPAELLPRVFDLFSQGERTLDRSQGGLGLGLALVRRLVELHGGEVSASSSGSGQGACFMVRLPLVEAPAQAMSAVASPEEESKRLRILIVEDNPDGRETLVMLLGMQGHEVHEAEDGPAGVERALDIKPDAAVVDIGLPGFDGYEVARRLRSSPLGRAIRLIALTGYGQEEDRQNAFRAGFDSFLVKPADMNALNSILASV